MSNRCHFSLMMMTVKTDLTKIQANDAKKIANVFIFQRFSTVRAVWFHKNCFSCRYQDNLLNHSKIGK